MRRLNMRGGFQKHKNSFLVSFITFLLIWTPLLLRAGNEPDRPTTDNGYFSDVVQKMQTAVVKKYYDFGIKEIIHTALFITSQSSPDNLDNYLYYRLSQMLATAPQFKIFAEPDAKLDCFISLGVTADAQSTVDFSLTVTDCKSGNEVFSISKKLTNTDLIQ
ncbi:hypothetical protein ACFL27_26795, partial [candidate division CSSED10-310 bacterium]